MNTQTKIKRDLDTARRAVDKNMLKILITLYSEIEKIGKDKQRDTTNAEAIAMVKKFIKGADEMILHARDLQASSDAKYEKRIFEKYIPAQIEEQLVSEYIIAHIAEGHNLGQIMKWFSENHAGLYDGKHVSGRVRELLSNGT